MCHNLWGAQSCLLSNSTQFSTIAESHTRYKCGTKREIKASELCPSPIHGHSEQLIRGVALDSAKDERPDIYRWINKPWYLHTMG